MIFRNLGLAKTSPKIRASCFGCSNGTAWPQFFKTHKCERGACVDMNYETAACGVVKSSLPITTVAQSPALSNKSVVVKDCTCRFRLRIRRNSFRSAIKASIISHAF